MRCGFDSKKFSVALKTKNSEKEIEVSRFTIDETKTKIEKFIDPP